MSDFGVATPREEPDDAAHDAVRDALPALLYGRVTALARAELHAHVAVCGACDAELRTLAAVRDLYATPAPAISVDRITAAVRARTIATPTVLANESIEAPAAAPASRPASPVFVRATAVPPRQASAWARRGAVRAFAASALLAIGSGALLVSRAPSTPARHADVVAAPAHVAASAPAADPNGSLLGVSFSDLSDSELAAVVAAVDDPAAPTPAAEPAQVTPTVLAPDGE